MPKDVHDKAIQELKKLEAMPPMSAESTVSRNYLDWLLAVRGRNAPRKSAIFPAPKKCLTKIIMGWRRSRNAFLNFWLCGN